MKGSRMAQSLWTDSGQILGEAGLWLCRKFLSACYHYRGWGSDRERMSPSSSGDAESHGAKKIYVSGAYILLIRRFILFYSAADHANVLLPQSVVVSLDLRV
jgi:hypothetical protein